MKPFFSAVMFREREHTDSFLSKTEPCDVRCNFAQWSWCFRQSEAVYSCLFTRVRFLCGWRRLRGRSLAECSNFVMSACFRDGTLIGDILQGKHLSLCLLKMLIGNNKADIMVGKLI